MFLLKILDIIKLFPSRTFGVLVVTLLKMLTRTKNRVTSSAIRPGGENQKLIEKEQFYSMCCINVHIVRTQSQLGI
jgi:hypothetical protein